MSRIFEALRRSEQDNAKPGEVTPQENVGPWQELFSALESQRGGLESVQRVLSRPRPEEHLVSMSADSGPAQERFRVLCHRLQQLRQERPLRQLLVTSAIPKEGKTLVAINLASLLARNFPHVLLVDADMRNPGVGRALELPVLPGLAEFLEGRIELGAALRRVDPAGIYYMAPGRSAKNPGELFQKPSLPEFIDSAAAAFDWVIFDSPPLNLFADAQRLAVFTDAVLLVLREGLTPREAPEQCMTALEGRFIAGVVLNASTEPSEGYYADYLGQAPPGKSPALEKIKTGVVQ